jgi:cytochrome b subunit of formate dehydrogenase
MARRSVNFYLVKVVRVSGWFLFLLMVVYIVSGYAMCGEFGLQRLVGAQQALALHKALDVPLVALFLTHSLPSIYLALRRWTWRRRKRAA